MMDSLARYQTMDSAILELIHTKRQKKAQGTLSFFSPSWLEEKKSH